MFEYSMAATTKAFLPEDRINLMTNTGLDRIVFITKADKHAGFVVYPGLQSYVAVTITNDVSDRYKICIGKTVKMGKEEVDGHSCEKSTVILTNSAGNQYVATVWNAVDLDNFPIKIESIENNHQIIWFYKNVSLSKPEPGLFEVASNYKLYDSPDSLAEMERFVVLKKTGAWENLPDSSDLIPASDLLVDADMNKDVAGSEEKLCVDLRMKNGKTVPFALDTGSTATILDKSLEPLLEPYHFGSRALHLTFVGDVAMEVYEAPKLYLGTTLLRCADVVYTADVHHAIGMHVMGILGMDCLKHYCVQFDFANNKIHFLDPEKIKDGMFGEKYSLTYANGTPIIRERLFSSADVYCIDTGYTYDAALNPNAYLQTTQELCRISDPTKWMSMTCTDSLGIADFGVFFRTVLLNKNSYTNFLLGVCPADNLLGLRFLARHLVTLNFPKNAMYIQRRNDEPFVDDDVFSQMENYSIVAKAADFLTKLKDEDVLPGWPKDIHGEVTPSVPDPTTLNKFPVSVVFIATKQNDSCVYYYTVLCASKDGPFRLQKAWRTDSNGRVLEAFPVGDAK